MEHRVGDQETLLEIGLMVFLGVLLGAAALLAGGRSIGELARSLRHRQPAPSPGKVPASRHKGTASAAAR